MPIFLHKAYRVAAAAGFCLMGLVGMCAADSSTKTVTWNLGGKLRARLDAPVVVCTSEVGEKRWGFHQFVSISDYPGGRILLRHHAAKDAVESYGKPAPTYISEDQGKTWKPFVEEGLPSTGMSYPIFDGQYICMPIAKPLDTSATQLKMPAPVDTAFCYGPWKFFRVDQCPAEVQRFMSDYDIVRWDPRGKCWEKNLMTYETSGALVWSPGKPDAPSLLSRTCFERGPLRVGNELLFADYRSSFVLEDGTIPRKWGISCMVSKDNGKHWKRRATIAIDREGTDSLTEPMLAENVQGELVCVIRRADQDQKSMLITYSRDRGATWEKPVVLDRFGNFGVYPALVTLDCGVMVLSYGRPGVYLSVSTDGLGREWTDPVCMVPGDPKKVLEHTDGYTCLLPIGPNELLVAYTDFHHMDANGQQRKAIIVRPLTIESN